MAIINRLARLFKADLHAVLDHIEEPELQLKQAIREMQEELADIDAQTQQRKLELDNLSDRKKSANAQIVQAEEEISVCFANKNEDLARGLIRRKLETSLVLTSISETQEKVNKSLKMLEGQFKEYSSMLESMQQKADLIATTPNNRGHFDSSHPGTFTVSDDDVEVALLKERQQFKTQAKAR